MEAWTHGDSPPRAAQLHEQPWAVHGHEDWVGPWLWCAPVPPSLLVASLMNGYIIGWLRGPFMVVPMASLSHVFCRSLELQGSTCVWDSLVDHSACEQQVEFAVYVWFVFMDI